MHPTPAHTPTPSTYRLKEEWVHTGKAHQSIIKGAQHRVRVVTAAALIMFAGFVPLDNAIMKPIAFALAVGVVIDAFIVRITLVPAVLALIGRRAWWLPTRLDKILPNLDIEGANLQKTPPADHRESQLVH
ncbi:MMPL family transporter [Streptomyces sp. NPDC060065]|uniref:MMPL family transporter n=1 Tax=Streptomyces sp. NPDC060065 TaxID=3347050 RepID=UPI0036CE61BA